MFSASLKTSFNFHNSQMQHVPKGRNWSLCICSSPPPAFCFYILNNTAKSKCLVRRTKALATEQKLAKEQHSFFFLAAQWSNLQGAVHLTALVMLHYHPFANPSRREMLLIWGAIYVLSDWKQREGEDNGDGQIQISQIGFLSHYGCVNLEQLKLTSAE